MKFLKFIQTFVNDNGPSIDRMRSPHPRQIVMNVHHSSAWAACIYVSQITNMPLLQGRTLITLCNCSLVTLLSGAPCVLLKGLKCPPAALQPSLRSPNWWTWNPWTPGVRPSISPEKLDFMLYCGDVVLKSDSLSAPWSGPYLYLTFNIALEKFFQILYFVCTILGFSHLSRMIKITNCRVCLTFGTYCS